MYSGTSNGLKDMAWLRSKVWLNDVKYAVRNSKYRSAGQKPELVRMSAATSFEESRTQKNELRSFVSIVGKSFKYMDVMLIEDDFALKNVAMPQTLIGRNGVNELAVVKTPCTLGKDVRLYPKRAERIEELQRIKRMPNVSGEKLPRLKPCLFGPTKQKSSGFMRKLSGYPVLLA